jgi:hypothetical protein
VVYGDFMKFRSPVEGLWVIFEEMSKLNTNLIRFIL